MEVGVKKIDDNTFEWGLFPLSGRTPESQKYAFAKYHFPLPSPSMKNIWLSSLSEILKVPKDDPKRDPIAVPLEALDAIISEGLVSLLPTIRVNRLRVGSLELRFFPEDRVSVEELNFPDWTREYKILGYGVYEGPSWSARAAHALPTALIKQTTDSGDIQWIFLSTEPGNTPATWS
jgi:hypothetical protein